MDQLLAVVIRKRFSARLVDELKKPLSERIPNAEIIDEHLEAENAGG